MFSSGEDYYRVGYTLCNLVDVYRHFGRTVNLLLAGCCLVRSSTLKMEAVVFSEMLVNFYNTTRRNVPEDSILLSYRR
jgi:hypothetical protein